MKTIRITGRGSLRVSPDKTRIYIALNDVCEEYAQALEKAAQERQTLQGVIREFGFAENDLKTLNFNVDPEYDHNVIGIMDEERIHTDVAAAREQGADLVIVFAHWGEEYEESPVESERYWAGVMQDAGVDVVIGGHPHVIQPVEVLERDGRKMLVCWSVGNVVSTQNDARNMVGGMVKLNLVKDGVGARVDTYEFMPTVTQKEPYTTNMCAYKLSDYTDELAAQSTVSAWAGEGGTLGWYLDYCAMVLGDAFDWDTRSVHGTL